MKRSCCYLGICLALVTGPLAVTSSAQAARSARPAAPGAPGAPAVAAVPAVPEFSEHLREDAQQLFSILELAGHWQPDSDQKLAELHADTPDMSIDRIGRITTENAKRLFTRMREA